MATLGNNLKDKKSSLYTKPVFVIFTVISIILFLNVIDILKKYRNAYKEEQDAKNEFNRLQERRVNLEKDIEVISTEKGVEELIRTQYPIAKPDEGVIMIVDSKKGIVPKESGNIFYRLSEFFKKD